ncbi:cytidine deaminase [Pseudaeromonas paramecii]|uniref:Cytidine deaminase n=1 Tax=Pseudaeromonas paramecii TaxID=2138166 RepID=A0ABP8PWA7_9GAMM
MFTAVLDAIATLPTPLASLLAEQLEANQAHGAAARLSASQWQALQGRSGLDDTALSLALLPVAAAYAHTPISHFNVGVIALAASGTRYFGANFEFPDQPLGASIHAEQSAINHAWLAGETRLLSLTVNASPCGHCRQFINETQGGPGVQIQLPQGRFSLTQLLPYAFGPTDLGITQVLMSPHCQPLAPLDGDSLLQHARTAAEASYAPYSGALAGVALASATGQIITGRSAENAAYNPSLPAMQSALAMAHLQGWDLRQIRRAALVEARAATSQLTSAQTVLASLCPATLDYLAVPQPVAERP